MSGACELLAGVDRKGDRTKKRCRVKSCVTQFTPTTEDLSKPTERNSTLSLSVPSAPQPGHSDAAISF